MLHPPPSNGFIDSHTHVWSLGDGEQFPLREKIAALQRDFSLSDLRQLQHAAGVSRTILIQAVASTRESLQLLRTAEDEPWIAGAVCWADPRSPDLRQVIGRYRKSKKFLGVRPMPTETFGCEWLAGEEGRAGLQAFLDEDCALDFLVTSEQLPVLHLALKPFPGLRGVLNHGGRPPVMAGMDSAWRQAISLLARETTLTVKCSGLVERAGVEWTAESLTPWIGHLLEVFGTRRTMFGSNWPVLTLASTYQRWVETFLECLHRLRLSRAEIAEITHDTADRHYRLAS